MIRKVRNSVDILWSEYNHDWKSKLRQYLLLAALLSFVFIMISFPMIYNSAATGPYKTAEYDIRANGVFDKEDQSLIQQNSENSITVLDGSSIPIESGDKSTRSTLFYVDNTSKSSELLPINEKMLIEGSFKSDQAVISRGIANDLSITTGDEITIILGNQRNEFSISGIVRSGLLDNAVVADRPKSINNTMNYTTIYSKCNNNCSNITNEVSENISVTTRAQELQLQEEKVNQFTDSLVVKITSIGGIILYILVFIRNTIARIGNRQKLYGTLRSLGANRSLAFIHLTIENVFILLSTTILGLGLSISYFRYIMNIYMTGSSMIKAALLALGVNFLIISAATCIIIYKLSKESIADQLEVK